MVASAKKTLADWDSFASFQSSYHPVSIADGAAEFIADFDFARVYPILTELLRAARMTSIETSKGQRAIFAWTDSSGNRFGWLCFPPALDAPTYFHNDHRLLLKRFGGIDRIWNGPSSFLDNQTDSIAVTASRRGFSNEKLFRGIVEDRERDGFDSPMEPVSPREYVTFTTEANGDFTVYHKVTGKVLHVGFDCGLRNVTALDGYPDLVFTINGVPDFRSWVESVAQSWRTNCN